MTIFDKTDKEIVELAASEWRHFGYPDEADVYCFFDSFVEQHVADEFENGLPQSLERRIDDLLLQLHDALLDDYRAGHL